MTHKDAITKMEQSCKSKIEELHGKHELAMKELASSHATQLEINAKRQRVVLEEEKIKASADTRNRMTDAMTAELQKQRQHLEAKHRTLLEDLNNKNEHSKKTLLLQHQKD